MINYANYEKDAFKEYTHLQSFSSSIFKVNLPSKKKKKRTTKEEKAKHIMVWSRKELSLSSMKERKLASQILNVAINVYGTGFEVTRKY